MSLLNSKRNRFIAHALVWIVYVIYVYIINWMANSDITVVKVIFHLIPFCVAFYVTFYAFLSFQIIGLIRATGLLIISILVLLFLGYVYVYRILPAFGIKLYVTYDIFHYLQAAFLGYVQHALYAVFYFVGTAFFKKERRLRILERERFELEKMKSEAVLENVILREQELQRDREILMMEMALLKAQINPHFLHNTLNSLFSQALIVSDELAGNIRKVSTMMRYALDDSISSTTGIVPAADEVKHLLLYIDIYQLRYAGRVQICTKIDGVLSRHGIPVLSMITIVENALKYGDLFDAENPVTVVVECLDDSVMFTCRNKKKAYPFADANTLKIGIANLAKRLQMLYPEEHTLSIYNSEDFYTATMIINRKDNGEMRNH